MFKTYLIYPGVEKIADNAIIFVIDICLSMGHHGLTTCLLLLALLLYPKMKVKVPMKCIKTLHILFFF